MAKTKKTDETTTTTPEPQVEKLNRQQCANKVVKDWLASNNGDTTLDELSERADKLFQAGHEDAEANVDMAGWSVQTVLEQLEALGLLKMEWHCGISPLGRLNGNGN